jgi:hypothetical protein
MLLIRLKRYFGANEIKEAGDETKKGMKRVIILVPY